MKNTPADLDQLLQFLTSLRAENDANVNKWLFNGTLWESLPISQLKEMICCFSGFQATLQALIDGMQRTIASLEPKGLMPFGNAEKRCSRKAQGILGLPNEILSATARSFLWPRDVIAFSQTCTKLREVALSCQDLWSTISSRGPDSYVETCLERSKESALDIQLEIGSTLIVKRTAWQNFTTQIARHSHRWRSFRIDISVYDPPTISLFALLGEGTLSLPKLQSLTINHEFKDDQDDESLLANDNFHFYSSWSMPNLTNFEFANFIPRAVLPPTTTTIAAEYIFDSELDAALFLNFLRSNLQIRHLSVETMGCEIEPNGSLVVLDKVESFAVKVNSKDVDHISHLIRHIRLPNVEEFRIDIGSVFEPSEVDVVINTLLSGQEQFDKTTKFELNIIQLQPEHEGYHTGKFFSKLPNLKALSIDASYESMSREYFWDQRLKEVANLPELDSIDLSLEGNFYHQEIILDLLNSMKVGRLNVYYCPPLDPRSVEMRCGDTKLAWGVRKMSFF